MLVTDFVCVDKANLDDVDDMVVGPIDLFKAVADLAEAIDKPVGPAVVTDIVTDPELMRLP